VTAKSPLLLLHGVTMSAAAWADVVPLLIDHYDVIAPTAAGHHGGPSLTGKASIAALTDQIEGVLDARGLDRVHVAGNSLGGWMAIELARRNRALTVCAFSPAGFWTSGRSDETRSTRRIRRMAGLARITRPVAPAALRVGFVRRLAMRDIAEHGERLTAAQAVTAARDTVNCSATSDLLATPERVEPLDPVPCPITLAWSANDRIFPPAINGAIARNRLPQAAYVLLPDVGHVPMIDDPGLCARVIRISAQRVGPQNSSHE
jgi:pimeloyl-ACP methyl ester carboxylesterase